MFPTWVKRLYLLVLLVAVVAVAVLAGLRWRGGDSGSASRQARPLANRSTGITAAAQQPLPNDQVPAVGQQRATDRPLLLGQWLAFDPDEVISENYSLGLRTLQRYLATNEPKLLREAAANFESAIKDVQGYQHLRQSGWTGNETAKTVSHTGSDGRASYPYKIIKYFMYAAYCRERLGDTRYRDSLIRAEVFTANAYHYHFFIGDLAKVIGFELLQHCYCNVENMGWALKRYAAEHKGAYPAQLNALAPRYIKQLPRCPARGAASYAGLYKTSKNMSSYEFGCGEHKDMGPKPVRLQDGKGKGNNFNAMVEQYKVYPMVLGDYLDLPRRDTYLGPLIKHSGLKPGDDVADIGSGPGLFTFPFAEHVGEAGSVVATDINASVVGYVNYVTTTIKGINVKAIKTKSNDAMLPPGSVDVAFIIQMYHGMWRQDGVVSWLKTVYLGLRPGGRLVIQDTATNCPIKIVKEQVTRAGLEVVKVEEVGDRNFIAVFKRPK